MNLDAPMPMLQVRNVVKRFDGATVVDHVTLEIAAGEIVCLLGPSGCGKTTLLRTIAGLEEPDEGAVLCAGQDLAGVPVHRRYFGFMFQEFALFPHRSVGENIAFGLRMQGRDRRSRDAVVADMLALIGLPRHYAERSIFELSGGERQRVALARSLAPNPRLLMLDEPLGSLDRALRERLMLELRAILKQVGMTAIYVTHDQEEAYAVADRIVVMQAGRIVQEGTPQRLYTRPETPFVARFLGLDNLLPVTVSESGDALVAPYGRFLLPPGEEAPTPGSDHLLLIHPEAAVALAVEQAGEQVNTLSARLVSVSFRGDHFEIAVDLLPTERPVVPDGATRLSFHIPTYGWLRSDHPAPEPGTSIELEIDPAKTSLLPPTEGAATP